jgi:hypothetical protein
MNAYRKKYLNLNYYMGSVNIKGHFTSKENPLLIQYEAGYAPEPVWKVLKKISQPAL